jgi:hypothetical protein
MSDIAQKKVADMTESELAILAAAAPRGFTPVFFFDGKFGFIADSVMEKMSPQARAALTIVGRAH